MDTAEIRQKLGLLAAARRKRAGVHDELIVSIIEAVCQEIPEQHHNVVREVATDTARAHGIMARQLQTDISKMESTIKEAVIEHGASVRAEGLLVTYSGGSQRWDSPGLKTYAAEHEELWKLYKTGNPSASIKKDKRGI